MATITAGDFRNGKTFEMDGKIFQVVEFQHGCSFRPYQDEKHHHRRRY